MLFQNYWNPNNGSAKNRSFGKTQWQINRIRSYFRAIKGPLTRQKKKERAGKKVVRLGQFILCKRYVPYFYPSRSGTHRRLWSRRGTGRIKIGSVPVSLVLVHRVNTHVPVRFVCYEPALFCPQLFTSVHMRIKLKSCNNGGKKSRKGTEKK